MKKLLSILVFIFSSFLINPFDTCSVLHAQGYTIHTYAGNGTAAFRGNNSPATAAEFHNPCSLAFDEAGNLYIADYNNYRVRRIDDGDSIFSFAGAGLDGFIGDSGSAVSARISHPTGVACDNSGNIYIADYDNNRIRRVGTANIIVTIAGNGTAGDSGDFGLAVSAQLKYPLGIAADRNGNIYFAEGLSNCVREINSSGIITTFAGNRAAGFSGDGMAATAAELSYPYGVAADDSGNVYIADAGNNRIRKVNALGIISTVAGNGVAGFSGDGAAALSAELNQPQGMALDGSGNMYITDYNNQRIRMISGSDIITTIAGNGSRGFAGDGGAATAAELNFPSGMLAADRSGNIYMADQENQRIRKLIPVGAGISEVKGEREKVKVYPNPNNGEFVVQWSVSSGQWSAGEQNNVSIEIYNVVGEKVYSSGLSPQTPKGALMSINLTQQPNGVYFYKIESENGTIIGNGKLVIKR